MSTQSLWRRLNELANELQNRRNGLTSLPILQPDIDDIRAILRLHKEAKRENAAMKRVLRTATISQASRIMLMEKGIEL